MVLMERKAKPVHAPTAKQIRAERELRGLTQAEAGKLIGVTWRAWAYFEAGRVPSPPLAILLRQFCDKKI